MHITTLYTLLSVLIVSLMSFVGVLVLSLRADKLKKFLIYLIAFSAGALIGDTFIHLLPEVIEKSGSLTLAASLSVLGGFVIFFAIEKFVHWQHCHMPITKEHVHSFAYMNLIGDGLHNLIDGMIIAASYMINIPVGIATTLAVALHEIPQEIGDFGVLLHGGFSKGKSLLLNFASALMAVLGAIITLVVGASIQDLENYLVPIAAGGFLYIAGSDLIPELHKESEFLRSFWQLVFFIAGISIMLLLLKLG